MSYEFKNPIQSKIELTEVVTNDETPTCYYKTLTFVVSFDWKSSHLTFTSKTAAPKNPNFSKHLSDLIGFKSDADSGLTCYFVSRAENYVWKLLELQIVFHPRSEMLMQWIRHFEEFLGRVFRPKSLFFIINPKSGNNSAKKHFVSEVEPLLRELNVKSEVHYTTGRGDATVMARKATSLGHLDGLAVVSGDGTFNEAVTGVLERDGKVQANNLPVCVIPCGTANTLSYSLHGTDDKQTALLHILLGDTMAIDVMSATNLQGKLLGVSLTMIAFGFFADALKASESYRRWLPGTLPYTASFIRSIMRMKKYKCTVELSTLVNEPEQTVCKSTCEKCLQTPVENSVRVETLVEPVVFGIQLHSHTSKCEMSPRGANPFGHFSDGLMEYHIMRDVERSEVGDMLKEVGKKDSGKAKFDFVDLKMVTKIKMSKYGSEKDDESCFILDGEPIDQDEVEIACHQRALTYFGRGVEMDFGKAPEPLMDKDVVPQGSNRSSCSCSIL